MVLSFHPAKKKPKTAAFLAFALGILIQALWQWLSPLTAILLWSALVFSLRDFFSPTQYRFSAEEITITGPLKLPKSYPWRRFRSYIRDRNGLFLSPYRQKRSSEGYRGIFLALEPEQKQAVEEQLKVRGLERRQK